MATANLGSIAVNLHNRIDGIPTTISGELVKIVDEQRLFMEEYTGQTIGSVGIQEKYQPALTKLSTASLLQNMQLLGGDASQVKIGDMTVSKGKDSNLGAAAAEFQKAGLKALSVLGRKILFRRVL